MKNFKIKTARGLLKWCMNRLGFKGWASFWGTIYLMPGYERDERLIRHERRHLEQIEEDGRALFTVLYLYWLVRVGYWDNPYEVDARAAEQARPSS